MEKREKVIFLYFSSEFLSALSEFFWAFTEEQLFCEKGFKKF